MSYNQEQRRLQNAMLSVPRQYWIQDAGFPVPEIIYAEHKANVLRRIEQERQADEHSRQVLAAKYKVSQKKYAKKKNQAQDYWIPSVVTNPRIHVPPGLFSDGTGAQIADWALRAHHHDAPLQSGA